MSAVGKATSERFCSSATPAARSAAWRSTRNQRHRQPGGWNQVFVLDAQQDMPPLAEGWLVCLLFGDVWGTWSTPRACSAATPTCCVCRVVRLALRQRDAA